MRSVFSKIIVGLVHKLGKEDQTSVFLINAGFTSSSRIAA